MSKKIYIATSWKMEDIALQLAARLRAQGHEVDCFCDASQGRFIFHYSEVFSVGEALEDLDAINFLKKEKAQRAYKEDKKWLDWADACVLVLPSGKSAHLEAGYAKGQGKKLYIVGDFPKGEFDVMYGFADGMFYWHELEELLKLL